MSQSPRETLRLRRYENGWEAINRMIREGGSWSGRERNCVHLARGDGRFVDISASSGLDFRDDGRSLARLDIDEDGRPDLVLRNRSGPQLRILLNRWPGPGRALWIRLTGTRGNRDAIGARVTVTTERARKAREVTAGAGFLSQSSRWLSFGLGGEGEIRDVEVRWPGGATERLGPLDPALRWLLTEGQRPRALPFKTATALDHEEPLERGTEATTSESTQTWLLETLAAPGALGRDATGREHALSEFAGEPTVLYFVSRSCAVCRRELPGLGELDAALRAKGARLVVAALDAEAPAAEVFAFLRPVPDRVPTFQLDSGARTAWNLVYRNLFNAKRDLVVPTTFLLNARGEIEKVYRGSIEDPGSLLADAGDLPRDRSERLARGLPFPGRVFRANFRRDLLGLGNALHEAGLNELARATFRSKLERGEDDLATLFNYALATSDAGDTDEAREVYTRILERDPDFVDAENNLAILEAKSGRIGEARRLFRGVLERNPLHTEAVLNLANTHLEESRLDLAEAAYREGLRADPDSAVLSRALGYLLLQRQETGEAASVLERARSLDPEHPEAYLYLAIVRITLGDVAAARATAAEGLTRAATDAELLNIHATACLELGQTDQAENGFRRAIVSEPRFDRPYLGLCEIYIRSGELESARRILGELLEVVPEHEEARRRLAELRARR